MINWQKPVTAPKDTSWIATISSDGRLEGRTYDREHNHWRVWSIPGFGDRICTTTSDFIGWARWNEVFAHIQQTSRDRAPRMPPGAPKIILTDHQVHSFMHHADTLITEARTIIRGVADSIISGPIPTQADTKGKPE